MLSCILIDDENHALNALKQYISHIPTLHVVGSYSDPLQALNDLQNREWVDLVLLDINMPELSGIDLAKLIRNKTRKLVFTTGHAKYAYKAFEVRADAYLLKPYTLAKFLETIQQLNLEDIDQKDFFFVKSREDNLKMIRIFYKDITAVESKLNYIKIYTAEKQVTTYMSLTEMGKILSNHASFMQIHRSFIVQTSQIKAIDGNTLELNDGLRVTVGEYYKNKFQEFMLKKTIRTGSKN